MGYMMMMVQMCDNDVRHGGPKQVNNIIISNSYGGKLFSDV